MEHMTVADLVEATGGRLLCGPADLELKNISIDSRTMAGADLFVPLIGEKVDAHRFISGAFQAGAAAVLTSEHEKMEDGHPWIRVADTKQALQDIGRYCRKRLAIPIVGITGSVGKTTTREFVAAALSAKFRVFKTPGNHNSQVGVPITLSEITGDQEIAVLELGMSMPGELSVIAKIAQADMALITNVGVTHIEQLGSRENIYKEKISIQDGLKEGGTLFLNGDDDLLCRTKAKAGCSTVFFGTAAGCDYRAVDIRLEDGFPAFTADCRGQRIPVHLGLLGRHNVLNAMAALAVADAYGVDLAKAAECLAACRGYKNRQQIYEKNGVTILDDTYNASPVSMIAGLESLCSVAGAKRRIAVLADMKELGAEARRYHHEIGEWIAAHPLDALYTVGDLACEIESGALPGGAGETFHFAEGELDALFEKLSGSLKPGDAVLLKGSNSMRLSEVSARLLK